MHMFREHQDNLSQAFQTSRIIQKIVEIMWERHVKNERFERFSYLQFDTLLLFT